MAPVTDAVTMSPAPGLLHDHQRVDVVAALPQGGWPWCGLRRGQP